MTTKVDATAPASAEKRHLSVDHDDNAAQHPKRARSSPLRRHDVAGVLSRLKGRLNTVSNPSGAGDATPSWEHHEPVPGISEGSPTMDFSYDLNEPKCPAAQLALRAPTVPDPSPAFATQSDYYDTCFGVIRISVVRSFTRKEDTSPVPVRLRPSANFLKIYFEDTTKYAGIVTMPALSRLLTEFTTKLDAMLISTPRDPQTEVTREEGKYANECHSNSQASLRIVVYGTMEESSKVGRLLSDSDLYLQHPRASECHMDAEYFNPHFLVRPGFRMPRLEELDIPSNNADTTYSSTILDETNKNRLMRIFDSAHDDGITPTVAPSSRLPNHKRHQMTALTMMSERECGLEMGLGKTLSLISLICWSIDVLGKDQATEDNEQSSATLIVTPKSITIYHCTHRQGLALDFRNNDIALTTYETMRFEFENQGPLYARKWFRVVLDEAHHIGNRSTMKFRAACEIQARRRWCLTGTPIHNSLDNYGALLSFIGVSPFIEKSQFDFWVANPIKGKRPNSCEKLQLLIRCTSLRRTKQVTEESLKLPPREEKTELIDLHESERELYEFFRQQIAAVAAGFWQQGSPNQSPAQRKDKNILSLINLLRLICDHRDLLSPSTLSAWRAKRNDAADWRMMLSSTKICVICNTGLEESSGQGFESAMQCGHPVCVMCSLERQEGGTDMGDSCFECSAGNTPGNGGAISCSFGSDVPSSSKIHALLQNLRLEQAANQQGTMKPPIKSVVFSYWTKMLDLVQKALHSSGFNSQRLDGQMSLRSRSYAIRHFVENPRCTVLLATINCAGEGIDLTAANFVHLVEPHWNPMVEAQAIARVHRIGQSRSVMAVRYVTRNSIEEYVRWIQEDKLRLIARSLNLDDICQKEVEDERWKVILTIQKHNQ
ncbi:hypothetical protein LY78DRAFT_751714 [Colletotrichum sublineola]|nr:hypothetical protein LY78DRAFT_751714 [Colletotrichum sublineola]